jgi:hypothetical protein
MPVRFQSFYIQNTPVSNRRIATAAKSSASSMVRHPIAAPILRSLPERVKGIPIRRDSRDFAAEIPKTFSTKSHPYSFLVLLL